MSVYATHSSKYRIPKYLHTPSRTYRDAVLFRIFPVSNYIWLDFIVFLVVYPGTDTSILLFLLFLLELVLPFCHSCCLDWRWHLQFSSKCTFIFLLFKEYKHFDPHSGATLGITLKWMKVLNSLTNIKLLFQNDSSINCHIDRSPLKLYYKEWARWIK